MRLILTISIFLMFISNAFCNEWKSEFIDVYRKQDILQAVIFALEQGVIPNDIMIEGLQIEGLNPMNLVMALYCAGVPGKEVRESAQINDLSEMVVTAGYKKSIVECSDSLAESQAYTPINNGFVSLSNSNGSSSSSPSSFDQ